ncbi:GNAT family N-acetyltransferase [Deinococcus radiophilus]|uniref:GNAT family N-acetyltransferase n=1 Tax=Deinococcus radiophilus TaxID=32062 RepID=UPI001E3D1FEA|nr:GNAT family N-acetyltransferase [Deinococcus radiophilus]UFA50228.1 GNAT family N-acetyltransferase [Deinococcus radiophilus]
MAGVHTQSWRETYTGLLSPDFLERATNGGARQRREQGWQTTIEWGQEAVFIAEQDGKIIAFASVGPARDHPGYTHELMTLYSLRESQGQGVGKRLLRAVICQVQKKGGTNLALWVLATNPTRQWYASQGAREAGEKLDSELQEVRMVWDHLPG